MRTLAAAAALAAGIGIAPAGAAEKFSHEGWQGLALVKDGKFIQCQMSRAAINNYDVIISHNPDGELRLGIRSHKIDVGWGLLFQQKYAFRIQVDDSPILTKTFVAKTGNSLSTSLNGTDWDKRLPNGRLLRVNDGRVRLFHLNGIREALGMLRSCVAKHRTA